MDPPPSTPSASTTQPQLAILRNSPALHSLKRQQLTQLCKQFNLKANGKNVELIERLKQHGESILLQQPVVVDLDQSNTSWDLVSPSSVPDQNELKEFGFDQTKNLGGLSTSGSNSSIASTIRSAGTAVFKKFTQQSQQTATTSVYPSLEKAFKKYPPSPEKQQVEEEDDKTLEDFDHSIEGAIRRVTTHSTANTSTTLDEQAPNTPTTFVFGSPNSQQNPSSTFNFEMTMPGSLLSLSTTSTSSSSMIGGLARDEGKMVGTPQVSILEEMNRRALESRLQAEKSGIKLTRLNEGGGFAAVGGNRSPEKRTKEGEFDGKHKRVFDKMDSIVNHYAAKRPHPSSQSSATLTKSSSSKTLNASSNERPMKRVKPSITASTSSSRNIVSALRDSGWSSESKGTTTTMTKEEKVSLRNSIRGVANSLSGGSLNKGKGTLESIREEREKEREERKRKLEMAKARRKSGVQGTTKRRRPSTIVGPKHSGSVSSTASSFLKSTFKRLTTSSSTVPPTVSETPRFAIPTASSSSRAGLVASSSLVPSTSTRTLSSMMSPSNVSSSPKKKKGEPGWKKFDLQESLKRPMTWKTHLTGSSSGKPPNLSRSNSNASLLSPPPLSRQVSARVANPSLLAVARSPPAPSASTSTSISTSTSTSTSTSNERSITEKLASLPSAPTTPFTNLSNTSIKSKGAPATQGRKLVSSTTKKVRSGKPQTATKIEGLETKARKIRAVRRGGAAGPSAK
ncbi:hypothetical protein JCM3765_006310 [Sporobolomyces pararoseus]